MGILDKLRLEEKEDVDIDTSSVYTGFSNGLISDNQDNLRRRLGNRQIQLMAIGGSVGTALFVSIGSALAAGGPGSLFLAYTIYSCMLALVNNCIAEMTVFMPVSGGFVRLAGAWVDDAFGFMAGYNLFFYQALLIPFEITALCQVLKFWRDDIPYAAVIGTAIALYAIINVLVVRAYGEVEFWLSSGKVLLIMLLFCFTFVTMCGGNPEQDAYGFRYWRHPGAFADYLSNGSLGRFEGFLSCVWSASFCIVGPEYCSIAAAETKRPRIYVKSAFKMIYWRFGVMFIIGALTVGVLIPYNDPKLPNAPAGEKGLDSLASPYIIAMSNLRIRGLPHLVNALLISSIFSAGNTYTYCAIRTLYGLALEGRAPKIFRLCTLSGIPIACFCVVMVFPCLAFLQLSNGSAKVLTWLINLTTAGGLINYIVMTWTYICFYKACQARNLDRQTLPYVGWFQPYCAYIGLAWMTTVVFCYGYSSFTPWSVESFFTYYTMLILAPILFVFWKVFKRTTVVEPTKADLVWERPGIDVYESTFLDPPVGFWREIVQLVGIGRRAGGNDKRLGSSCT